MFPIFTNFDTNIVLGEEHISDRDVDFLFGGETWLSLPRTTDIFTLLVECKVFTSKSEARKNWKKNGIIDGWNEFLALGKMRRNIFVWKPTEVVFQD